MNYVKAVEYLQMCGFVTLFFNLLAYAVVNEFKPREMYQMFVAKWDKILKVMIASYFYVIGVTFFCGVLIVWLSSKIG